MEQTPASEADNCSVVRILYRIHRSQPLNPILSQLYQRHVLTAYSFKISINIIILTDLTILFDEEYK